MTKSVMILILLGLHLAMAKRHIKNEAQDVVLASEDDTCYGVIFDAGSSGTRVFVYSWPCRTTPSTNPVIHVQQKAPDQKKEPGISTFNTNIAGIEPYLDPLLSFAKSQVPADKIKYTPVFMGATAGMRLLTSEEQKAILTEVRRIFAASGFLYMSSRWVRVISGRDEGAYLWLSANYIMQKFVPGNVAADGFIKTSYATVDLGGASTQLADQISVDANFDPSNEYKEDFVSKNVKANFEIYSHSWLGYGQDQARIGVSKLSQQFFPRQGYFENPCFLQGYMKPWEVDGVTLMKGTGNPHLCRQMIHHYFHKFSSKCDYEKCGIEGVEIPEIKEQDEVYAASGIYFAKSFLKLPDNFKIGDLRDGFNAFCQSYQNPDQSASNPFYDKQCFNGIYSEMLLQSGYKIGLNTKIISGKVHGIEPTWTLAAIFDQVDDISGCPDSPVCQLNQRLRRDRHNPIYHETTRKYHEFMDSL